MTELRIVLADDHELVRSGLRVLVESAEGMRVVGEARNGEEAVERACALQPDVLVMDVSMPVLDGAEAMERLSRECPGVKVLVLTAHDDRATTGRLLRAGAAGYLLKRAAAGALLEAIRSVAAGGSYVDPVLAASLLRPAPEPATPARDPDERLSEREEEVLRRIAWGASNKEIGARLGISTKTVETYRARIAEKLGLRGRSEIVRYAVRRGWLSEE